MKKALVVAICLLSLAGTQRVRAENAGLGFTWGVGPQISLASGFSIQGLANNFTLGWMVGESVVLGVFNESSAIRGTMSYTTTASITNTVTYNDKLNLSGIKIATVIPGMEALGVGLEVGTATFGAPAYTYTHSDGTTGVLTDFGVAGAPFSGTNPLLGVAASWQLLSSKAKGIWTSVDLQGALRFIPINDTALYGTRTVLHATPAAIAPISSFNQVALRLGITIGF